MRFVVVTPAGRERYLRLLAHYVLASAEVDEWQLWDNCRTESDRRYLHELVQRDERCTLKTLPGADGGWAIIGDFFRFCDDPDALYLRLDDDIVFIEPDFFPRFRARAMAARGTAVWFSPLIINNAICNWLLKFFSRVDIKGPLTCQAMCPFSWAHASFAAAVHPVFVDAVRRGRTDDFRVPDRDVRLSRFSINAFGFFGADKAALGEAFYPPEGNEEEWLSAVLPAKLDRPGRIFGDLFVAHFSFYTQERALLATSLLESYYGLAGIAPPPRAKPRPRLRDRLRPLLRTRHPVPQYEVALRGA